MKKFDPTQLIYFTGSEKYYQLSDATPSGQTPLLRQNRFHVVFLDWIVADSGFDIRIPLLISGATTPTSRFFWITRRYMRT